MAQRCLPSPVSLQCLGKHKKISSSAMAVVWCSSSGSRVPSCATRKVWSLPPQCPAACHCATSDFATSHPAAFHTVQNSGAEAHTAKHSMEMPVAVLGCGTGQCSFGDRPKSCVTLWAAPWLSHKPCPHTNYFTAAFGSHEASQIGSVLTWVALQHHLKSFIFLYSMCPQPITPKHPIILNDLSSYNLFEMRVLFSAFYRQGASCSFSEISYAIHHLH